MSYKKHGREQNKVIICLSNYWYGHCFWDGEKQQKTTTTMTNNVNHNDYPKSPTTRHFSNSKQNCSQRHRAVTVTIFPLHWGIFCHFFFADIITDSDWTELVAVIKTYIYIYTYTYIIYIHKCTYTHIMQTLTWWAKRMLNANNSLLSLFYNRCGNITMANTPSHNSHHEYWTAASDHRPATIPESLLLRLSLSVFVANIAVDFIAVIAI